MLNSVFKQYEAMVRPFFGGEIYRNHAGGKRDLVLQGVTYSRMSHITFSLVVLEVFIIKPPPLLPMTVKTWSPADKVGLSE